jgi:hypothetical protein
MSVKKELYELVKAAVTALPEVKTFGHFNNQFDTEEDEQTFNNPAVFFEFADLPWQPSQLQSFNPQGTQQQKSEACQFTLHISYWSHEEEEDKFLALLDLVGKVYGGVTTIESANINPIQRLNDEDSNDHTEPIVWKTTFATMLTEQGIAKPVSPVSPSVNVQTSNS